MTSIHSLKCSECFNSTLTSITNNIYPKYKWLQCYKCGICDIEHFQCSICMNKLMTRRRQVTDHGSYHNKRKEVSSSSHTTNDINAMTKRSKVDVLTQSEEDLFQSIIEESLCLEHIKETNSTQDNSSTLKENVDTFLNVDVDHRKKFMN